MTRKEASLRVSGVFAVSIFTSAALLFLVQPMVGKMLLPPFGGAASVWTTCLLFYQVVLLAGYLYAHLLASRLGTWAQVAVHLSVLGAALFFLPIGVGRESPPVGQAPTLALLGRLTAAVGLPFFALSGTGTLFQSWFSRTGHPRSRDPYFLYSASNLGSMTALLSYPVWFEPTYGLSRQSVLWAAGFAGLLALAALSARVLLKAADPLSEDAFVDTRPQGSPSWRDRATWLSCASLPTSLMMGVTLFLTTDIAPVPLLWIIPLALYLLAFILGFAEIPRVVRFVGGLGLPAGLVLIYFTFSEIVYPLWAEILLHLVTVFLLSVAFLGKLAERRPSAAHLTEFYLVVSLGGVVAGLFNAVFSPLAFKSVVEYSAILVVATALLPVLYARSGLTWPRGERLVSDLALGAALVFLTAWVVGAWPLAEVDLTGPAAQLGMPRWRITTILSYAIPIAGATLLLAMGRRLAFAVSVAAFGLICAYDNERTGNVLYRDRSFYSVLAVRDFGESGCRTLTSGTTWHGRQAQAAELKRVPQQFYHPTSPIGQLLSELKKSGPLGDVGVVGLGTGTLAAYGERGDRFTFFEIDPAVAAIAQNPDLFTYLSDSPAEVRVVLGDARLRIADEPAGRFHVLIVDAFSSDAIPVHLLTREALSLYIDKLGPDGVLVLHVSNRYLVLPPMIGRLAQEVDFTARLQQWSGEDACGGVSADWVMMARDPRSFGALEASPVWEPIAVPAASELWTDDFSNLLGVFKWLRPDEAASGP